MVVNFSGKIDWETTVQLLETGLWKRQKNKLNAFLTRLRCRYNVPDNINHIPDSIPESQYARICYPSSGSVTTTTATSSSSFSSTHYEQEGGELEEPRLKGLILPWWGRIESAFSSIYSWDNTYLDAFIVSLIDWLSYLAQFCPRSPRHGRFLEDEFVVAISIDVADTGD
ncbi:hypothetical protein BG015_003957, partial [Linnemannia schmuckeri]